MRWKFWKTIDREMLARESYAQQLYAERWANVRCVEAGIEELLQRQVQRGVIS